MRQFSRIFAHNDEIIELFGVEFEKVRRCVTMQCLVGLLMYRIQTIILLPFLSLLLHAVGKVQPRFLWMDRNHGTRGRFCASRQA